MLKNNSSIDWKEAGGILMFVSRDCRIFQSFVCNSKYYPFHNIFNERVQSKLNQLSLWLEFNLILTIKCSYRECSLNWKLKSAAVLFDVTTLCQYFREKSFYSISFSCHHSFPSGLRATQETLTHLKSDRVFT